MPGLEPGTLGLLIARSIQLSYMPALTPSDCSGGVLLGSRLGCRRVLLRSDPGFHGRFSVENSAADVGDGRALSQHAPPRQRDSRDAQLNRELVFVEEVSED